MLNLALIIQLLTYVSFVVFVTGSIRAVRRYAAMPMHLRWELYPVAHERGRDYGGSYLEEIDWWTKPRSRTLVGEARYMGAEGLLFQSCFKRNKGLWYWTYPFHIGVLLISLWLLLLLIGACLLLGGIGISPSTSGWGRLIFHATKWAGGFGLSLSLIGCIGLLFKRLLDSDLRSYTVPADYVNLLFTLLVLLASVSAWLFYDHTFSRAREYVASLVSFKPARHMNTVPALAVTLFSLFLVYIPFSQLKHGFAKYFTYHRVRWEDEPNLRGSVVEKKINLLLDSKVTWTGPHIQEGQKWCELLEERPTDQQGRIKERCGNAQD